ncbi:MAG: hypothetical protein M0018_02015 [Nitrospiraceae bacterium]|nr:hypothetical protein [Nitrospiraceae bacterium]
MRHAAPGLKIEPGSWVMFLAAWWTGAAVSAAPAVSDGGAPAITPFSVLVFLAFCALLLIKPAAPAALKQRAFRPVLYMALPPLAVLAGAAWLKPSLASFYLAGGVLMAIYFFIERKSHFYAEIAGMAVMGLAAAVSVAVNNWNAVWNDGGPLPGIRLGLLFFAFFLSSPLRVRLASPKYRKAAIVYSGVILACSISAGLSGHPVFFAFLPLAEDLFSAIRKRTKENFRAIGITESVKTVTFAILVAVLFN